MSGIHQGPALQRAGLPYSLGNLFMSGAPQSAGIGGLSPSSTAGDFIEASRGLPPAPTGTIIHPQLMAESMGQQFDRPNPWATPPAPAPTLPMTREQFDSIPNPDASPPPVASPVQGPSTANMGQPRQSSPLLNTIASRMKGPITSTAGGISTERSALGKPF
jgi:hypothetical protein